MTRVLIFVLLVCSVSFAQFKEQNNLVQKQEVIEQQFSSDVFSNASEKKSKVLAAFYSFLLPGMGELYAGNYSSGKYFTIAEAGLWGIYGGMNYYASWQEDNYKEFAQVHGSVAIDGKDEDYFANIGVYKNIEQYNDDMASRRRFEDMYSAETHYWSWEDGTSLREDYRSQWKSSETAYDNLQFVVGAMILNRLVSAINAVRQVGAYNNRLESETSWNVSFGCDMSIPEQPGLKMNFITTF